MPNKDQYLSDKIFKRDIEKREIRDGFGEGLVVAAEENEKVVVLSADLSESTRASFFREKFPQRYFEVGVAEQSMVLVASGMANYGKIPFITSFSIFAPGRVWEMIRTTICLNNVPVKIVGSHAGLSAGPDGGNHQATEDIALMQTLPNMVVLVAADALEAKKAVIEAAKNNKPTFIRTQKYPKPVFTSEKSPFKIGKAEVLWDSKNPKVAIVATGPLVYEALKAAWDLKKSQIDSVVINCHTVKPIDRQTIIHAAKISGAVVSVEEHQIIGGLGSTISEVLAKNFPVPIEFIGMNDVFGESGKEEDLLEKYGLKKNDIVKACKKVIRRKDS